MPLVVFEILPSFYGYLWSGWSWRCMHHKCAKPSLCTLTLLLTFFFNKPFLNLSLLGNTCFNLSKHLTTLGLNVFSGVYLLFIYLFLIYLFIHFFQQVAWDMLTRATLNAEIPWAVYISIRAEADGNLQSVIIIIPHCKLPLAHRFLRLAEKVATCESNGGVQ